MLNRLSLNQKRIETNYSQHNSHYNEKQNIQKNLNRGKRTSRLNQMDPSLIIKPIDHKNYLSNADIKLNLSMNFATNQHPIQFKPKISARHSLQKNRIQSLIPNEKRKSNTEQFCELYGKDIINESELVPVYKCDFLKAHEVNALLRARMLDWMVEVMKSYKFTNKTYFSGVDLMDRYFSQVKQKVPVSQLHIIGVVAMFIATKMDQIYPLKVKTVYEKIVHKKITKQALVDMQMRFFETLKYKVNSWTFFDLAILKVADQYQNHDSTLVDKMEDIISFISKCISYDYELYTRYDMQTFARVVVKIAANICNLNAKIEGESARICRQDVIRSFNNFKQNFKGLNNILKFTDQKTVNLVETYCHENKNL